MTFPCILSRLCMVLLVATAAAQPLPVRAAASSCAGVVQEGPISDPRVKTMIKALLVRQGVVNSARFKGAASDIEILQTFQQGKWAVYRIAASAAGLDPAFLFVNRTAAYSHKPYVWSGSATPDERTDIVADIETNNKGIGKALATCVVDTILGTAR